MFAHGYLHHGKALITKVTQQPGRKAHVVRLARTNEIQAGPRDILLSLVSETQIIIAFELRWAAVLSKTQD